jgi:hypothetical protein
MIMIPALILLVYCWNVERFSPASQKKLVLGPVNFTLQAFPILLDRTFRFKLAQMIFFSAFRKAHRAFHPHYGIIEGDLSRGRA